MRRIVGLTQWIIYLAVNKEITGSQMAEIMEKRTGGKWRPSYGHLYPTLKKLEAEGYLIYNKKGNEKYYKATKKGIALLDRMGAFDNQSTVKIGENLIENIETFVKYAEYIKRNVNLIIKDKSANSKVKKAIDLLDKLEFD